MRTARLVLTVLSSALAVLILLPATPSGSVGVSISGGGIVDVTDMDGNQFLRAGQFSVNGGLTPAGSAYGTIHFVARGAFADYWGAIPGVTDVFTLSGDVTSGSASGGDVSLSGLLYEADYADGQGVIYEETDVPFTIVAQPGSSSFVMQFCLLPPFGMHVAAGTLRVNDGTTATARALGLQPPATPAIPAMTCAAQ